jgi:prepilin-type N-terminal cleavage/methylation domain-containing protein/prepilin-type processing-associated H-X9-DG protein
LKHRGFTLIELLVVIAIIAILAAILFPVFAQAKAAAKKATALSNYKQLVLGNLMYLNDYDDTFVVFSWTDYATGNPTGDRLSWEPVMWRDLIYPYVKNGGVAENWTPDGATVILPLSGIFQSVGHPQGRDLLDMHHGLTSGNETFATPYTPLTSTSLTRAANTEMIMEKGYNQAWDTGAFDFYVYWWAWQDSSQPWPNVGLTGNANITDCDGEAWDCAWMPRYRYSGNSMPVGYCDGHVKSMIKGAMNWCTSVYIDQAMSYSDGWVFDAGQPCQNQPKD